MVRLDSTVTAALVHEPSDSSLLWDAVRVMVRLLQEAKGWWAGRGSAWRDHRRAAKKRARRHPVHPRSTQTGAAVPRADQDHPGHLGLSAPSGGAAGHDSRLGGRALAGQGRATTGP